MTNLEALMAECEPFTISQRVLDKVLSDCQLGANDPYTSKSDIAKAAAMALSRYITLRSENEGSFSLNFDLVGLQNRIRSLCLTAGLNASDYLPQVSMKDGSSFW